MTEIWKPVAGYEGAYEVSNNGRIRRITYRLLKPFDLDGYCAVSLCNGTKRKTIKIHRLVAEAFIPNPESKQEVNHINFDKKYNSVKNLEWCTASENVQHNYNSSKTNIQRGVRCLNDGKVFVSQSEAARYYDISQGTVSALCRGTRVAVGVPDFEYYDLKKK